MDAVLDELEECVSGKDDIERQWEMKELIAGDQSVSAEAAGGRNDACLSCGTGNNGQYRRNRGASGQKRKLCFSYAEPDPWETAHTLGGKGFEV